MKNNMKNQHLKILYTTAQVAELDRIAINHHNIPGLCLMERAGSAAFQILKSHWLQARSITVVCGIGNNAGDGYVLARLAHLAGYHVSVTFIGFKQGLFTGLAPDFCDKIYFDDLKVPSEVYQKVKHSVNRIVYDASLFPKRLRTAHKGKFGHVLSIETAYELKSLLEQIDTIAIGPGLGQSDWGRNLLNALQNIKKPIVVDADALNLLAQKPMKLANAIFTPHPGEAARLLKLFNRAISWGMCIKRRGNLSSK
jgi:hypothetical protein